MQQQQEHHVPVVRDYGAIQLKKDDRTVRNIIDGMLCESKCFHEIKPFFIDGGVCGHKVMDLKGAVDVLKGHDKQGRLRDFEINDFRLGNALKNALRSRYTLNKRWKIEGENKRVAAPVAEQETK